ncbi:MAG: FHA domain-containing protein, partial [Acidobacteria bacterium]
MDARFELTDAQGRRVVPIDQSPFTIGRRAGNHLRLESGDISREHAEVVRGESGLLLRDRGSRFGTFVNGARVTEHALKEGDRIRLGQSEGVEMTFHQGRAPATRYATERASTTGSELHQVSMLLEGLRALGSARVLDEVLAMVLDSAIDLSGAERGFVMLADESGRLEFKLGRARGGISLSGRSFATSRKIPEEVFAEGQLRVLADLLDGDLPAFHSGTIALGIRHVLCIPLRLVRYVDRAEASTEDRRIGVLYLDSREKGKLLSGSVRAGMEALATEAAVAIENARLYREAV